MEVGKDYRENSFSIHLILQCVHLPGHGFQFGAYECLCHDSDPNSTNSLDGYELESNEKSRNILLNTCECNPQACPVVYNRFLRMIIVIIQAIFLVFVAILAAIVFQRRKVKIIKYSMWILLELILFGAALLYASV